MTTNPSVRILIRKLIGFLICIVILQALLLEYIPALELPVHPYVTYLKQQLKTQPDILYLGDSVIGSYDADDSDKRGIDVLLQEQLPEYKISGIHGPGLGMDMFLSFVNYVVQQEHPPQVIIVPINMRSFSLGWEGPGWQFGKEQAYLKYYDNNPLFRWFFKPLTVFKAFDPEPTSEYDYQNKIVYYDNQPIAKVKEMRWYFLGSVKKDREIVLIYNYMYHLTPAHRFIRAIFDIQCVLQTKNIKVIFYITPLDYKTGVEILEEAFHMRLTENVQLLKQQLANNGIHVIDLSQSLGKEAFDWERHPNEHLNEHGRKYVAGELAKQLTSIEE